MSSSKSFTLSLSKGFGIVEVIIALFVIGVVFVGVASLMVLTIKASSDGQRRIIATALANEKMEMVRNLPHATIGTVGGVPSGPIASVEEVTRNGSVYTVATDIRYIDDPYDGTAGSEPSDMVNTDYKQIRVEVSWGSSAPSRPVLLITQVAPRGVEGGSALGTLVFQALNAAGQGVAGAVLHMTNSSVSPSVNITTTTNDEGIVTIPGLTPSAGSYELSVTKDGYTSEQTFDVTSSFTPDTDHSHLSALASQVTNKTFSIDVVSSLTITTRDAETSAPLGGIAYRLTGTKKIGTDADAQPVYVLDANDTTDGSGSHAYEGVVWDAYTVAIDGAATGYDIAETSKPLPLSINPGAQEALAVHLAPHTPASLHVTVVSPAGDAIEGVSVQVTKSGYDETKQTGLAGQVFFPDMEQNALYDVAVSADTYQSSVEQVTVDGTVGIRVTLVPV